MNSPPILEEIQVINPYDDKSFIREEHSRRLWPTDPTRAVDLSAHHKPTQSINHPNQINQPSRFLGSMRLIPVICKLP
jgi:hypothetical protein